MGCSLYIRGSIIEEPYPFDASDIDFFSHWSPRCNTAINRSFMSTLSPHFKAIDVVPLTREAVQENIVFHLLIHTRSLILAGPKVDFSSCSCRLEDSICTLETFLTLKS